MFETTLKKIGKRGLYFFIPINESLKLKEGKIMNIQINDFPPFLKKLNSPQNYVTREGKVKWLFQIAVPHTVTERYKLRNKEKIKVIITNGEEESKIKRTIFINKKKEVKKYEN